MRVPLTVADHLERAVHTVRTVFTASQVIIIS